MERIEKLPVEAENQIDFGGAGKGEGLMLAGDQNIVDVRCRSVEDQDRATFCSMLPSRAQITGWPSAMREVVVPSPPRRSAPAAARPPGPGSRPHPEDARRLPLRRLDHRRAAREGGSAASGVDAFEGQRAEQNQNKLIREAEQYRNQVLGRARGDAAGLVADAKAYKSRVVAEAQGEAQRCLSVYAEYDKAKDVTRQRLFLETLEDVLRSPTR